MSFSMYELLWLVVEVLNTNSACIYDVSDNDKAFWKVSSSFIDSSLSFELRIVRIEAIFL